ncbi:hypothetical protein [Leuconostoc pseudomesenteroides]|uniref:hypothetical protein n=1 Tax=Leuconostoc pseudomesenteroides TaxID=33968 RepID=UPI00301D2C37
MTTKIDRREPMPTKEIKKRLIDKDISIRQMARDISRSEKFVISIVNNKVRNAKPTEVLIKKYLGL